MGFQIKLLAILIGFFFLILVLNQVRKNNMHPSYSVLWVLVSLFLLSVPILEPLYKWIATALIGIIDARHIIYVVLIGFLLIYIFFLTVKITRMSDQIQNLISHTSILENEIRKRGAGEGKKKM
ncbi:MAG TPA: DUF2304 domain-containing protein [Ignavibacteria bacterium]|nr:DUF2304 domain-containing protein [Ignavibacteria bacterium]